MSTSNLFTAFLTRYPAGAAILYVGVVMAFAITAWTTVAEILQRRDAVAATASVLSQLEAAVRRLLVAGARMPIRSRLGRRSLTAGP